MEIRRLIGYRDSFAPAEVSFPASLLADVSVARWLRQHRQSIDVRTMPELHSAISVGIHPAFVTVHAERFTAADLGCLSRMGVGRVVVSCTEHIALLGAGSDGHTQQVLLRMTDVAATGNEHRRFHFDSRDADFAVEAIVTRRSLKLIGLQCDVGTAVDDFVSYPAAIGNMIAQMEDIRREHGTVLTRLGLAGGAIATSGDGSVVRQDLAEEIDESVDDACATLRFPRPVVVISAGSQIFERRAA